MAGFAMMMTRIQHGTLNLVAVSVVVMMVMAAGRGKGQKGNQREEEVEFLHGWFSLWLVCWGKID